MTDGICAAVGMTPREFYDLLESLRRPGASDPDARLADMDADGIDAAVLYPSNALFADPDSPEQFAAAIQRLLACPVCSGALALEGDGLRCAGGSVIRLETVTATGGGNAQSTVQVGTIGMVDPGDTRYYQYWYRDLVGSPCGTGFNVTNGLEVLWAN